jgi:hypothetical protein
MDARSKVWSGVDDLMLLCTGVVRRVFGEVRLFEYMFLKGEENPI